MNIETFSIAHWIGIAVGLLYFPVLAALWMSLSLLKHRPEGSARHKVSVVIAARNEEGRIAPCLESLAKLDYPADLLEIILVDDDSSDRTPGLIQAFCDGGSGRKLVRIAEKDKELRGKKKALSEGIALASGEIIFVTDADCMVPPSWIRNMVPFFGPGVAMVLGYSPLRPGKGLLHRFLQFDNLVAAISIAAPAKLGFAYASAGRNLAYRKDAYTSVGGYHVLRQYRSGDDTHLTERFRREKAGAIDFCADPATFVQTGIPESIGDLLHQQIRKNSRHFRKSPASVLLTTLLLISYLVPFAGLGFSQWLVPGLLFLGIRFGCEFLCLAKAALVFGQRDLIKTIPVMQGIYPPVILFFSIIGFFKLYRWKA